MKILFVTDNYHPAVNGIVTQIELLSDELRKRGHTVYIVCPTFGKGKNPREEDVFRLPSLVFPPRPLDRLTIPYSTKLTKKFLSEEVDIVHNHLFIAGFFGEKIAKKRHIPIVATLHTPFTQYVRWSFPALMPVSWPFLKVLYRWYFRNHDVIIGPSARATDELEAAGVKPPKRIIHNGIVLSRFTTATQKMFREEYKIPENVPLAISVGRLDPGKNVDLAIRATKIALHSVPNLKLIIMGDGVLRKNLEKLVDDLEMRDSVLFTGFVSREMIASANKCADISLMPSDTDTLPTVTIEAMATGQPIVAIYDKAVLDLVKDNENGFIVKKDPEEFANAMVKLLQDEKLREKFGKDSFEKSKQFSVESTITNLVNLYEELIDKKKVHLS